MILPAMPGFYHGVKRSAIWSISSSARICDQLGIENA